LAVDVKGGIPSSIGKTLFNSNPKAAAPNWKAIGGFKEYSKGVTGITLQNNLSENLINLFTFFGRLNHNFEKRPFNNLADESASFGFRNKLTFHQQKTDWILGIERITDSYRWELTKNENLINKNKEEREHLTAFILLYYRPVTSLNISLGGSFNSTKYQLTDLFPSDGNSSGKRDFPATFSPRIGINYAPNPIISFYASAGHGFSLPSPEETLQPEGNINPEIKPETGIQYELGARLFLREKRFELDATLYQIDLQNLLVTKRLTEDQFTGINAGKTNHKGIELAMKKELFNLKKFPGNLTTGLSYFRSVNRFIDFYDNGNNYNGNLLPGIPKQTLAILLKWLLHNNTEITSDFNYNGNQYLDDSNNLTYPGYCIINFKVKTSFNLNKQIKIVVYGGIKNLTDTNYASMLIVNALSLGNNEPRFYYPGQPRNFYSGIQFSF
jgi:iron complex outermembrane receptor protein